MTKPLPTADFVLLFPLVRYWLQCRNGFCTKEQASDNYEKAWVRLLKYADADQRELGRLNRLRLLNCPKWDVVADSGHVNPHDAKYFAIIVNAAVELTGADIGIEQKKWLEKDISLLSSIKSSTEESQDKSEVDTELDNIPSNDRKKGDVTPDTISRAVMKGVWQLAPKWRWVVITLLSLITVLFLVWKSLPDSIKITLLEKLIR